LQEEAQKETAQNIKSHKHVTIIPQLLLTISCDAETSAVNEEQLLQVKKNISCGDKTRLAGEL